MRAFGLYLSEIVLGGARDRLPERVGAPAEALPPLDATTLAAWARWAQRGRAASAPTAPAAGDGLPALGGPLPRAAKI